MKLPSIAMAIDNDLSVSITTVKGNEIDAITITKFTESTISGEDGAGVPVTFEIESSESIEVTRGNADSSYGTLESVTVG